MTWAKRLFHFVSYEADELVSNAVLAGQPPPVAFSAKDFEKLGRGGIVYFDFIRNSSQKRIVSQLPRIDICREHGKQIERYFELPASRQSEVIDAFIQRSHPAIEQFLGPHPLPAEIIDDQDTVIRFHLEWSGIEATGLIVL